MNIVAIAKHVGSSWSILSAERSHLIDGESMIKLDKSTITYYEHLWTESHNPKAPRDSIYVSDRNVDNVINESKTITYSNSLYEELTD